MTPAPAQAATNNTLNFQARLLNASGNLVPDGTYNMQFNLYTVASGGTTQWTDTRLVSATQGITIKNGYFSVNLGDTSVGGTAFPSTINWDQEQWLGLTVRGTTSCVFGSCSPTDAEMTPRFKLTSVPYAQSAGQLQTSSGANTLKVVTAAPTGNITYTFQDAAAGTYNVCTSANNCTGLGAYIQNGTALQSTANFNIRSAATGSITANFQAIASQSAEIIRVRDSADATTVFSVTPAGNITSAGTYNGNTFTSSALTFSAASATTIQAASNQNVTLQTQGTGTLILNGNSGTIRSNNQQQIALTRTLPIVVNDVVDIGTFTMTNGGGSFQVSVVVPSSGNSVAKNYTIPVNYDQTANTWVVAQPISDSGPYSGQNFALDARVATNVLSLRLRRTAGVTAGTAYVTIIQQGINTDAFTASTATASVAAPSTYLGNAIISQVGGAASVQGSLTVANGTTVSAGGIAVTGNSTIATTAGNTLSIGNSTGALTVTGNASTTFVVNGATVDATEFTRLDGKNAALVDANDAVSTAITGTGTLTSGALGAGFTTVAVGQGGTGATTLTAFGVLYGNGTGAIGATAVGTAGQCLVSSGAGVAPVYASCGGTGSGVTLQAAYDNSSTPATITAATGKNVLFSLPDVATDPNVLVNIATGSTSKFAVQNNGTDVLGVTSTGATVTGTLGVTGATTINTSGAATTTIATGTGAISIGNSTGTLTVTGNASSTFVLNGVTIDATEFSRLDGKDAALVDTNDAVAIAVTGTGALNAGSITSGFGAIDTGADNITTTGSVNSGALNATGAAALTGGASIRGLTVDTATVTQDRILITAAALGATRFDGSITNADLTAARTYTLPDASGTIAVTASGNIALSAAGNISLTGTIPVGNGGTGVTTTPTNGQLLVGNGTSYTVATLANNGGVTITTGAGTLGLAVAYGSTANTAAQGNVTFTCPSGTGNLSGGGTTITIGTGGTCGALTVINNPTFSGLVTAQAGVTLTNAGSLVTQAAADYATTGTTNDVNLGAASFVRLTGASAQTITGITAGANGRRLTIVNAGTATSFLANLTTSSAANQISTGTGASIAIPVGSGVDLIYDGTASLWRVTGDVAGGSGSGVTATGAIAGTNANGLNISGGTINLTIADGTNGGALTAGAQTIGGAKTFNTAIIAPTATNTLNGLVVNAGALSSVTTVNASGLITSVGVTAGSGLVQGTGGLTITGATSLAATTVVGTTLVNTTGTAATSIGNGTGILTVTGPSTSSFVIGGSTVSGTEFVLLDGRNAALVDTNDAVTTAITGTGALAAGSIASGFGTIATANTITGTTVNGTTGINTGAGAGTQRIDVNGNLVAIGNLTGSGAITLASTGAGNDIVINGADILDVQDNATFAGTLTVTGLTTLNGGLTLGNASTFATLAGTDYSTVGSANNVAFGNASLYRLTGASAQTITGIAGGTNGRILTLINAGTATAVLTNNDAASTATNRITTGTGASISVPVGSSITLVYDGTAGLWRTTGDVAGGAGSGVTTLAAIGAAPNANGATISGNTLNLQPADASFGGVVTTAAQTFAGAKTFNAAIVAPTATNTINGLVINAGALSSVTTLNASGLVTSVGVNAGAGLIQGTAGLTNTGNVSLATAAGNTVTVGNSTGILTVTGSNTSSFILNGVTVSATEFNLLDGKDTALVDTTDAVTTAITGTGALNAGSITSGFGAIDIGADTITSGLINGQTITSAANFTGSLAVTTTLGVTGNATVTGGTLTLNNGTSNFVQYGTTGVGAPTFTTRSAGTKEVYYNQLTGASADYAVGIEANTLWQSVPNTTSQFKWYGGTTQAALLSGTGNLNITGDLTVTGGNITNAITLDSTLAVTGNTTLTGDIAVNGGDITSTAATLIVNAGGTVDIQDNLTADAVTADTGNIAITSGALTTAGTTRLTNAGVLQNVTSADAATFFTAGNIPVADGGTGAGTFTANGVIYGNTTGALQVTAASTGANQCLITATSGGVPSWGSCTAGGGVTTVGAFNGGTANANGATITTNTIFLQSASATNPGLVDTTTQTFAGAKTFGAAGTALVVTNSASIGTSLLIGSGAAGVGGTGIVQPYAVSSPGSGPSLQWSNGALATTLGFYVSSGLNFQGDSGNPSLFVRQVTGTGSLGAITVKLGGANGTDTSYFNAGNVGFGDTSPAALLTVGNGDLFQVNSAGAIAASTGINTSGGYTQTGSTANTFTGATTINNKLSVTGTTADLSNAGLVEVTATAASTTNDQRGSTTTLTVTPGAASNKAYFANYGQITSASANLASGYLVGVGGRASYTGTGSVQSLQGISAQNTIGATGNVTSANGVTVLGATSAGGTIVSNYGVYIENQTVGSADYGIYIAGADTYALWVDAGATRLDGTLEVQGNTTLTGDLAVNGGDITSTAATLVVNAGGTVDIQDNLTVDAVTVDTGLLRAGTGGSAVTATSVGDIYAQDALEVDGAVVLGDAAGDAVNVNGATTFAATNTFSVGADSVYLSVAPTGSATSSSIRLGPFIAGGNGNGTYIGGNPVAFSGDFINLQVGGGVRLRVTGTGATTVGNTLTVTTGGAAITGNSTIAGTLGSLTGLTSSGTITFSGLATAGIVTNTAGGILGTTSAVSAALGGTGFSSYTVGDLLFANTTTTLSRLNAVAIGSCLVSAGVGTAPAWGSCGSGITLQAAYTADADGGDAIITTTTTDGGLIVRDASTTLGTASLFAVQNNGGTNNYLQVRGNGDVFIDGTDTTLYVDATNNKIGFGTSTFDSKVGRFQVDGAPASVADGATTLLSSTFSANTTNQLSAVQVQGYAYHSSATTQNYRGVTSFLYANSANTSGASFESFAAWGNPFTTGAMGTYSGFASNFQNSGTGTVGTRRGVFVGDVVNSGGGAITNNYGVVISDLGGVATNNTNLLIGAGTAGQWSMYNSSTDANYIEGDLRIASDIDLLARLQVDGDADEIQLLVQANATQTASLVVIENSAGTDYLEVQGDGDIALDTDTLFVDATNNRVSINTTANTFVSGQFGTTNSELQISNGAGSEADLTLITHNSTQDLNSQLKFVRSRGTSGAPTTVQSGDDIAALYFYGYDGDTYEQVAGILIESDGASGLGDTPGRITLQTTPDAAQIPVTRLVVESDGDVAIDTTTLFVDATGNRVKVGGNTLTSTVGSFEVGGTAPNAAGGNIALIGGTLNSTSNEQQSLRVESYINPASASTNNYVSVMANPYNESTNAFLGGATVTGMRAFPYIQGTSSVSSVNGIQLGGQLVGSGVIATASGAKLDDFQDTGAGSVTNNYGINMSVRAAGTNNTNLLIGAGTTGNWSIYNNSNYSNLFGGSILANNSSTGTTGTSTGAGNEATTSISLVAAGAFVDGDTIFVDNTGGSGEDFYTRIVTGGGTTTLTVSPAVSYGTNAGYTGNATITKYNMQNIGAVATGSTFANANRFFQGYFLGGIVTGAGSTTYSDGNISSTLGSDFTMQAYSNNLKSVSTILTGSIDPTASNSVTGVGTKFLTELQVGDSINVNGEVRRVDSISSDTALTVFVGTPFTNTGNDTTVDRLAAGLRVKDTTGNTNLLVGADGTVSIGTSQYSGKLFVQGEVDETQLVVRASSTQSSFNIVVFENFDGTTNYFEISSAGRVGIRKGAAARNLEVNGDIRVGSGTTGCVEDNDLTVIAGTCVSDVRLKKNIADLTGFTSGSVLDRYAQLRPVTYNWNATATNMLGESTEIQTGVIAQEVEALFPELVTIGEDGYKKVRFNYLDFYTIQAIKELKVVTDTLDTRLDVIEAGVFSGNLSVAGNAQVNGNLTVLGLVTATDLQVTGNAIVSNLTVTGKLVSGGAVPTVAAGMAAGNGITVNAAITGNDTAGTVSITTGTADLVAGDILGEVTFTSPYAQAPIVTISATTEESASIRYFLLKTTTGWSIKVLDAPAANKTYSFDYHVIQ